MMMNIFIKRTFIACFLVSSSVFAQQNASERASRLRAQLADIQAQETDLQTRLAQIDEAIKPENIERSLAGVGSVHPEELREARRRQLETQRRGIQAQLDTLTTNRQRVEAAIAAADAESYRQAVGPSPNSLSDASNKAVKHGHRQKHRPKRQRSRK
jgi:chaperonin cofactor prefoldin